MAVSFKSAERRAFWGALAFSLGCEYLAFLLYFAIAAPGNPGAWLWSLFLVIGVQVFWMVYAIFGFCRRALWYQFFEKESRSAAIAQEFRRLNFPRPEGHYSDVDAYLSEVALSPATSPEGALFAGTLIGALAAHRTSGPRAEAFFLALSIERAMKTMLPWEMASERQALS